MISLEVQDHEQNGQSVTRKSFLYVGGARNSLWTSSVHIYIYKHIPAGGIPALGIQVPS